MKATHSRALVLVILFLAMIILPNAALLMPQGENIEQRTLSEFPDIRATGIDDFPAQFDSYYNDRLPGKNLWVNLYSRICLNVFGVSSNSSVIVGKDGWLFFDSLKANDMDEMADYHHSIQYTEDEMARIAALLTCANDLYASRGISFYLMLCPNKSTVYGDEFLPSAYVCQLAEQSRTQQLIAYLKEHTEVQVVETLPRIEQAKAEGQQVYQKMDTHWNQLGAFAAYQALCAEQGKPVPALPAWQTYMLDRQDLNRMLALPERAEELYALDYHSTVTVEEHARDNAAWAEFTSDADSSDRWLVYHDSFMIFFKPFLNVDSARCVYRAYPQCFNFNLADVEAEQPTAVLLEMVERNVPMLLGFTCEEFQ
ncbi:MAG: hypothetical protein PHY12_00790 [Eubacteriales bacterium]|nr:hypothetical protein [Eubacteriales bacterium]